jgi:DNA polymerase-3 subunit gamma/tau
MGATDIFDANGAKETGIEDMRAITENLKYKPLEGGKKAVIVDECHALSKAAVQALLKDSEEPPSWVIWLFCTTEPTRIPVAIKTRATHYALKSVGMDDLVDLLDRVVASEGFKTPEAVVDLCAKEADGSPRQALSNLANCAGAKDAKEARELLRSAVESEEAIALARALFGGKGWMEVQEILNGLKEVSPEGIRHVVRAYATSVVLKASKEAQAGRGLEVLDAFSEPFHPADGISPVVLACGKLLLG